MSFSIDRYLLLRVTVDAYGPLLSITIHLDALLSIIID